ncbi:MAG TPA: glycerol-3-phosphate 1-O-acyltransferase PlsY [Hyphomicrobium sp.]|nr:glycerol-3-phosphate 1-O-acyltransferase PlsY [Hyphomicrobium sp.]
MIGGLWPWLIEAGGLGYLLGSIPFGLLLTRAAGLGDVRQIGSGNIGATNVLRTGSKKLAAATLLLDGLKGCAAVLLARYFWGEAPAVVAGLFAFLGHVYPVWLGFKGGKGVSTYIGVLAGLHWPAALAFCAIWLAVALTLKYSSLSALAASLAAPLILWWTGETVLAALASLLTALLAWKHRANIARLAAGTEPKIGAKT